MGTVTNDNKHNQTFFVSVCYLCGYAILYALFWKDAIFNSTLSWGGFVLTHPNDDLSNLL